MTTLSDQELLDFNKLGLIPGPNEQDEEFISRANYCLTLKEHLSKEMESMLGPEEDSLNTLQSGFNIVAEMYGISPSWIPIYFSNYRLSPWHGGCAWIFQMTDSTPTAALLQLRQSLKRSPKYLGIYDRDELVAHELAHVGRMTFEEPKYEEFFAYRTSPSAFRRCFGPIVQSSFESMLFVLVLSMIVFVDVFLLIAYGYGAYLSASWLKLISISMILFALVRLWIRRYRFNQCYSSLKEVLSDSTDVLKVMYRMTDEEISQFSKMDQKELRACILEKSKKSLRWKVIQKAYFQNDL